MHQTAVYVSALSDFNINELRDEDHAQQEGHRKGLLLYYFPKAIV